MKFRLGSLSLLLMLAIAYAGDGIAPRPSATAHARFLSLPCAVRFSTRVKRTPARASMPCSHQANRGLSRSSIMADSFPPIQIRIYRSRIR